MRSSLTSMIAGGLRKTLIRLDILASDEEADRLDAIDRDLRRAPRAMPSAAVSSTPPATAGPASSEAPIGEDVLPKPVTPGSADLQPHEGLSITP